MNENKSLEVLQILINEKLEEYNKTIDLLNKVEELLTINRQELAQLINQYNEAKK
jgi:exonuclease VII small subunit